MIRACVVGLGSSHGDDGFGWLVADRVAAEIERRGLCDVAARRARSPAELLDWLDGLARLLLIDACRGQVSGEPFLRLKWPAPQWQQVRGSGSHNFTLWQTLALADRLGRLPPCCRLWCVPGVQFDIGAGLSPSLLALAPLVAQDVLEALVP